MENEDPDQHEQAAGHGEEDELHGRVDAATTAPDADQEIHRDEHGLPEDIEEEQVLGDEDADHARLEQEHEGRELLDPLVDRPPRREQGDRRQEGGQEDQEQADAVDADVVIEPPAEPGGPFDELRPARGAVEAGQEGQGRGKRQEGHGQGRDADGLVRAALEEQERDGAGERQESDQGYQGQVLREAGHISRTPRKITAPSRKARA